MWGIKLRNKSFIIRVLLLYILAILIFLVLLFVFFFQKIGRDSIDDLVKHLDTYSHLMENEVKDILRSGDEHAMQLYLTEKARSTGSRITYTRADGTVLADTVENPSYMENHANREEIQTALRDQANSIIRFSNTLKKTMLYYAYPISADNHTVGVLRTSFFMESVDRLLGGLQLQYLLIIGFLVLLSIGAILVIYYRFKTEINRFSVISQKVSEGNFNIEFSHTEYFEIRDLSRSFENMIAKIKNLISEVVAEKDEVTRIISSIDEAIVVLDDRGKISRANHRFAVIFDSGRAQGRFYWEVIRDSTILELIKQHDSHDSHYVETEIAGRIILCSASNLGLQGGKVLVFSDITGLKNWETLKKELVANVSHELGTPLTSIRGYIETLLEEETDETKHRFLSIILKNTERLANIVRDLLTLSGLEEKTDIDATTNLNLPDVLDNVLPLFREKYKKKGLSLEATSDHDLKKIQGDAFKLEQLFINLLDNALKYTETGGTTVSFSNQPERIAVTIRDTGIGIPAADMERIFERFYVVDKSRSRSQGGTGLGLSIVKHIVLLHGGDIRVSSTPGGGTEFTLTFPAS